MSDVPVYRLYILRAYYALVAVGTMVIFWPPLLSHTDQWGLQHGAHFSLLSGLSPLFLLGIRYPLKMLPIILFEFLWKCLWLLFIALPLWRHGLASEGVWGDVAACSIAVILTPIVVPWSYLWRSFVTAPSDRWR